jgi:hypothetical protein
MVIFLVWYLHVYTAIHRELTAPDKEFVVPVNYSAANLDDGEVGSSCLDIGRIFQMNGDSA